MTASIGPSATYTPASLGTPRWILALMLALVVLTLARGAWLVLHRPLIGLANSYDEVRYSSCFDLAPIRPGVPPAQYNPQAPLRVFGFYGGFASDVCVWTSDVIFTAPIAYGWRSAEALGAAPSHSIGKLGLWRLLVWGTLIAWFTRAWLASGRPEVAFALLACTCIVFFDPGNTVLFNTWYAEPAATFGLYLACVGTLLVMQTGQRALWAATALGAAILAASKMQHVVLPLLLALTCLAVGKRAAHAAALALMIGGLVGATFSVINSVRPASHGIIMANRGDYVLMVLLPNVADPAHVARNIGLAAECAAYAGPQGTWGLPHSIDQSCPSLANVSSLRAWAALIVEPAALAHALANIPKWLLPWVSEFLGMVEGANYAHLPASQWSLTRVLGSNASVAWLLLALPWLVFLFTLRIRTNAIARVCAAMCVLVTLEVPIVAMFGAGYGDFAKHAQLAVVASLSSLFIPLAALAQRGFSRIGK